MTTSVTIKVNGRYRAEVKHDGVTSFVEGNYEGSSNPSGERVFWIRHTPEKGSNSVFEVTESYVPLHVIETEDVKALHVIDAAAPGGFDDHGDLMDP